MKGAVPPGRGLVHPGRTRRALKTFVFCGAGSETASVLDLGPAGAPTSQDSGDDNTDEMQGVRSGLGRYCRWAGKGRGELGPSATRGWGGGQCSLSDAPPLPSSAPGPRVRGCGRQRARGQDGLVLRSERKVEHH